MTTIKANMHYHRERRNLPYWINSHGVNHFRF